MKRYHVSYSTLLSFACPVENHHFLLRCLPMQTSFQRCHNVSYEVKPETPLLSGTDSFGNQTLSGSLIKTHDSFSFSVSGDIISSFYLSHEPLDRIYSFPSVKCIPGESLASLYKGIVFDEGFSSTQKACTLSHEVFARMEYQPLTTDTQTTAEEALQAGKGVCQDYAHILIALCRMASIPARYAAGLIAGEGSSHAWVEVYDDGAWHGMDPTNDQPIDFGYIKFSHGRDYEDCSIDRGSFSCTQSQVDQTIEVNATVEEISLL